VTVGTPVRRTEDHRLLIGRGAYVEDLCAARKDLLHVAFVRSPLPSARIRQIHTTTAAAAPGVVAVVTGTDLATLKTLPLPGPPFLPGFPTAPHHPPLALERVRFVGGFCDVVVESS